MWTAYFRMRPAIFVLHLCEEKSMDQKEIKDTYQQLGKELRELGAGKVILLSSRTDPGSGCIRLEIVAEGIRKKEEVQKRLQDRWPDLQIRLLRMEDITSAGQIEEIENDGIRI